MDNERRSNRTWNTGEALRNSPFSIINSPFNPGRRLLLPCPVLGLGGLYEYVLVDAEQARRWLLAGPCDSYLTHPMLHEAFETVMGFFTPPPYRSTGQAPQRSAMPQTLGYADDAMVFQVRGYETLPDLRRGDSQRVRELVEQGAFTLGLLRRLS